MRWASSLMGRRGGHDGIAHADLPGLHPRASMRRLPAIRARGPGRRVSINAQGSQSRGISSAAPPIRSRVPGASAWTSMPRVTMFSRTPRPSGRRRSPRTGAGSTRASSRTPMSWGIRHARPLSIPPAGVSGGGPRRGTGERHRWRGNVRGIVGRGTEGRCGPPPADQPRAGHLDGQSILRAGTVSAGLWWDGAGQGSRAGRRSSSARRSAGARTCAVSSEAPVRVALSGQSMR